MTSVILSPVALEDLEEIGDYIAKDNFQAALSFVARLRNRCYSLGDNPGIGSKRDELRPRMRSVAEGDYVILYRSHAAYLEIVRVVYGKRDIKKLFEESDAD